MEIKATDDPFATFGAWFEAARKSAPDNADAMALATADGRGKPSVRMVLLKGIDAQGFVFYTNCDSQKGLQIRENDNAALCFYWKEEGRQVRVEGRLIQVEDAEADVYFATRPRESQIGAWASLQSQPLENRKVLETRFAAMEKKYEGGAVPRPPHWSGFRLIPALIEFWQQGDHRLHDRFVFIRDRDKSWKMRRLYP